MKIFKRILSLAMTLILLISVLSAGTFVSYADEGVCGDSLTWRFSPSNGVLTILGEGEMYDYEHDLADPMAAPWKNHRSEIKRIILGSGVTSIGEFAFTECTSLVTVSFPLSVERIGLCAFSNCQFLTSITIPDNVTYIGSQAFIYCTSLVKAVLGDGLTKINYGTFSDCTSLKDVIFGKGLTSIASDAFYNCKSYENIVLPEQYVELSYESFWGTGFYANEDNWDNGGLYLDNYLLAGKSTTNGTFVIRPGTKYVASYSLYDLQPGTIYYPRTIEKINEPVVYVYHFGASHVPYDSPYVIGFSGSPTSGGTHRLCPPEGSCGKNTYYKFDETGTILTFYGKGAIKNYEEYYEDGYIRLNTPWEYIDTYIDEVIIEEGVTSIGTLAFPYVKKATLADSITHINSYAIRGSFTNLKLPKNLEYICPTNYAYITKLEEITISEDNPNFATIDGVLYSKDMKTLVKYPCAKKDEHFAVPDTVTALDPNAFNDLKNLKTLYIPETVTEIDNISKSSGVTIQCKLNSAAHTYAKNKKIPYEIICDHSFTDYTATSATCTEDGYKTAVCDLGCGAIDKIITDPAIGHKFTSYEYNNDATCTENGTSTAVCENGCGTLDTRVNENTALGHSFTDYEIFLSASCTEDEMQEAFCDRGCGAKDVKAIEGSALGHSFTDYEIFLSASCTEDEMQEAFCDRGCGAKDVKAIEGSALGHSYTEYTEDNNADCTHDGTMSAVCTVCNATDTVVIEGSALGHLFTNYETVSEASCTEDGVKEAVCDNGCGTKDVINTEAMGHTPGEWIIIEEPTYDYEGYKIRNCTVCSEVVNTETIPVLIYEGFPDVKEEAWYYEGVEYCFKQGYILGNDKGNFDPDGKLTREQFVVILARISGAKLSEYTESTFTDVKADSWYGPSVIWASTEGYINGVGNGRFGVGEAMTRETVAVMLHRYSKNEGIYTDAITGYNDYQNISNWAKIAVNWAVNNGILGSTSTDTLTFSPKMTLTRAQAAKIFMSFDAYSKR